MFSTTPWIAFTAGLVSFLSPCVLPLIPGYLSYLAGSTLGQSSGKRWTIFMTSVFFVLGFSVVFSALGIALSTVLSGFAVGAELWFARIGGAVIILFGLVLTGLIHLPFLEREYKLHPKFKFSSRYLTAFVFGAAFASGWTPCVGPVLGSILTLAAVQPGSSFTLLLAYSLGLALPFLVVGLFTDQASGWIHRNRAALRYVNIVFGILLIVLGVFVFTQNLGLIASFPLLDSLLTPSL